MKYERLTERDENGIAAYKQKCDADDFGENLYIQAKREGTVVNRLCELEDKIENGTLIELPCKVGDTVYVIDEMENSCGEIVCREVESCIAERISIFDSGVCLGLVDTYGTIKILSNNKVFLTKAEAEKKLKEWQGE